MYVCMYVCCNNYFFTIYEKQSKIYLSMRLLSSTYMLKLIFVLLVSSLLRSLGPSYLSRCTVTALVPPELPTWQPTLVPTEAPTALPTEAPTPLPTYTLFTNGFWKNTNTDLMSGSNIYSFSWYNSTRVIAIGSIGVQGQIWLSSNTGNDFTQISGANLANNIVLPALYDVDSRVYTGVQANHSVVIAVGSEGTIIVSRNAGSTWTLVDKIGPIGFNHFPTNDVESSNFRAVCIGNHHAYVLSDSGKVYKSTSLTGVRNFNWTNISPNLSGLKSPSVWRDIASFNDSFIIMVGSSFVANEPDIPYYVYSADGGINWVTTVVAGAFMLQSVSCNILWNVKLCVIAGSEGNILKVFMTETTPGTISGTVHSNIDVGMVNSSSSSKYFYNAVQIIGDVVFLATDQGYIYSTYSLAGDGIWLPELNVPHLNTNAMYAISMYSTVVGVSFDSGGNIWQKFPAPSGQPSRQPSRQPSSQPSRQPSSQPSRQPSRQPSSQPSSQPSMRPSMQPSILPSVIPSKQPSSQPSSQPSRQPSRQPTRQPSSQPSRQPSSQPSNDPTMQPSMQPSAHPTIQPSSFPTCQPSSQPSNQPTRQPFRRPSGQPSRQPSSQPSAQPAMRPSALPSRQPSSLPTRQPMSRPSRRPSTQPSRQPSRQPSKQPISRPSARPSSQPSMQPSRQPFMAPSALPSYLPTSQPSEQPSMHPTSQPSSQPVVMPTMQPSREPSSEPTIQPSSRPSRQPSILPSGSPSVVPTNQPTNRPTSPFQTAVTFTFTINLVGVDVLSKLSDEIGRTHLINAVAFLMPEISPNNIEVVTVTKRSILTSVSTNSLRKFTSGNMELQESKEAISAVFEVYFVSEWVNERLFGYCCDETTMSPIETFTYYKNIATNVIKSGNFSDILYDVSGYGNISATVKSFALPSITILHYAKPTSEPSISPFPTHSPTPTPPLLTKTQMALIFPFCGLAIFLFLYFYLKHKRLSKYSIKRFPGATIKYVPFQNGAKEESKINVDDVEVALSSVTIVSGRKSPFSSRSGSPARTQNQLAQTDLSKQSSPGRNRSSSPSSSLKLADLKSSSSSPPSSSSLSNQYEDRSFVRSASELITPSDLRSTSPSFASRFESRQRSLERSVSDVGGRNPRNTSPSLIDAVAARLQSSGSPDVNLPVDSIPEDNNGSYNSNNRNRSGGDRNRSSPFSPKGKESRYVDDSEGVDPNIRNNIDRAISLGMIDTSSNSGSSNSIRLPDSSIPTNSNFTPRSRNFELSKGFVTPKDQASYMFSLQQLNTFNNNNEPTSVSNSNSISVADLPPNVIVNSVSQEKIPENLYAASKLAPTSATGSLPKLKSSGPTDSMSVTTNQNQSVEINEALRSPALIRQASMGLSSRGSKSLAASSNNGNNNSSYNFSSNNNTANISPSPVRQAAQITVNSSSKNGINKTSGSGSNSQTTATSGPSNNISNSNGNTIHGDGSGVGGRRGQMPVRSLLMRASPYDDHDLNVPSAKAKSRKK